ncbi:putative sugar transporter [Aaosphaeria arxii CBS 175.79]|uniref:Putative sugar transporter n=1 Tax=Aaosphaeria arxii CBS 175.79 TaxID=1450172 RepID=A0A6A5XN29_9PLEO|nr:putative sugar transporter [Aaosphaeria arxii CBS 175.79]KAF2014257.1 putative sugar transporter [Aaosphaeria arxii CBS 175.79]
MASEKPTGTLSIDEARARGNDEDIMFANAAAATDKEHKMTLLEGVRLYPKAIGWAALISLCCAMEGYDIALIGNFYAFPPFNRKYGELQPNGSYEVPARWQAGISNGAQCGQILGLLLTGWGVDRFGYRPFILGILFYQAAITTIFFVAPSVQILLLAECLAGIAFGVFMSVAISYASDICPVALRGYLTTWGNSCWGIGQLIAIGVIKSQFRRDDQWAYRIPYGLQWMWFPPLMLGIFLAPESPWWLVRKGKLEEAKKSLLRLTSAKADPDFDVNETIDMIRHTDELEKTLTEGASYLDCFRGVNLRRTEIVCMLFVSQNFAGNTFSNYSTYFFAQAGLTGEIPYNFALGQYGLNTIGAFVTWAFMAYGVGRRTLFLCGLCGLFCTLLTLGFLGLVADKHAASLATGSLMIVWAAFYQFSVGTVAFSLVAEISSRRLQVKTVALSRVAYNMAAIVVNILTPYMLNPTAWNWRNFAGFFWAGTCFCVLVYHYFRLPEPSGRTFAEMDLLFERRIPARKFKTTNVNAFDVALRDQKADDKPEVLHYDRV